MTGYCREIKRSWVVYNGNNSYLVDVYYDTKTHTKKTFSWGSLVPDFKKKVVKKALDLDSKFKA